MRFDFGVYGEGLSLGMGLIVAIGAQNAFVLRQGIKRRHVFATALACSLIDAVLISSGVLGLGALINGAPALLFAATVAGSAFLLWFGARSFASAAKPEAMPEDGEDDGKGAGLGLTIATLLAFSLLNPHVYLDTVIMLGGIGARHPAPLRPSFIAGACSASIIWFFGLAYGAGFLSPLFKKKLTWRVLDIMIGCVMLYISARLGIFAIENRPK
jgi:L-lysine exporter family protein LysE/ArgO